jgi:DNA repair exonuclease SbcCD ATPase subunit
MNITTETIFWTQVASIIAFVVALFILYRLLVEQKDATIQLQKENISYLKDQLTEAKSQSPDVLAQSLASRVKLLEEELNRLEQDNSSTNEQVKAKEAELNQARVKAEELTIKVLHAKELLKDFLCPHCGAPLAERAYHNESVEYQGREIDVDHEYTVFECGYEIVDGEVRGMCKNLHAKTTA